MARTTHVSNSGEAHRRVALHPVAAEPSTALSRERFEELHAQMLLYASDLNTLLKSERHKRHELDNAYSQLLRYARDLKTTYEAERQRTQELHDAYAETLRRLTVAAEYKDSGTARHIRRMSHYSQTLARALGWTQEQAQLIFNAAPMHDIGKIGVPDSILMKEAPLTEDEWRVMRRHPALGANLLAGSHSPLLRMAAEIAGTHHECWDGSGYPKGLKGDAIPQSGRIVMVCDVYDALRSKRPYKPAYDHARSHDILLHGDGRVRPEQFDPNILIAFERLSDQFNETYTRLSEP